MLAPTITLNDILQAPIALRAQMTFDFIARHLFKQGKPSSNNELSKAKYMCKYRAQENGQTLKCAVGIIIPDENYIIEIENKSVAAYEVGKCIPPELRHLINIYNGGLLSMLQTVHDDDLNWKDDGGTSLRNSLKDVAQKNNLNTDVINTLVFEK